MAQAQCANVASEKTINSILDYVSNSTNVKLAVVQEFYNATQEALEAARSDRLGIKIKLKLARLWLAHREWSRLAAVLRELRTEGAIADSRDVQSQGTTMLEPVSYTHLRAHET